MEKELAKYSQYVGTLHNRDTFNVEILHKKFIWRSNSYLYVAKEGNSNIVKFFSHKSDVDVGDNISLTAYVKDHTTGKMSRGCETYFNRVKFSEE
jgi:hypothetical protein